MAGCGEILADDRAPLIYATSDVGDVLINLLNSKSLPMGDNDKARFVAREWRWAEWRGLVVKLDPPNAVDPVGDVSMARCGDSELEPLLLG